MPLYSGCRQQTSRSCTISSLKDRKEPDNGSYTLSSLRDICRDLIRRCPVLAYLEREDDDSCDRYRSSRWEATTLRSFICSAATVQGASRSECIESACCSLKAPCAKPTGRPVPVNRHL
jgi:hypothetical protein